MTKLKSAICASRGCTRWGVHPRTGLCPACTKNARAAKRREVIRSTSPRDRAVADLERLRRRVKGWGTKIKRAETGLKSSRRKLRAAEKRFALREFAGWDAKIPRAPRAPEPVGNPLTKPGALKLLTPTRIARHLASQS